MTALFIAAALVVQQPDLRSAESVTPLLAALRSADPAVCDLAGRSLTNGWGWSGDPDVPMPTPMPTPTPTPTPMPRAGGLDVRLPRLGVRGARDLDPQVLAVFRSALKDPNRCVRSIAARMVARARPSWAATDLSALAKDASPDLRETGLLGLGGLEDPQTIGVMTAALGDGQPSVRAMAAWALGQLELLAAIPA